MSLFYSIAEAARRDAGAGLPDFDASVEPVGAESGAAAVRALVDAAAELDLRRVIGMLPPDEMAALYDYAPLFLDEAEAVLGSELVPRFTVDDLQLDAETGGDTGIVTVESYEVGVEFQGEEMSLGYDGTCSTMKFAGTTEKVCPEDLEEILGVFGLESIVSGLPTRLEVAVVQVDGRWYVSPVRTGSAALFSLLGALADDALPKIAENVSDAFERFEEDPAAFVEALEGLGLFGAALTDSLGTTARQEFTEVGEAIGAPVGDVPTNAQFVVQLRGLLGMTSAEASCVADGFVAAFDDGELTALYIALSDRADAPPAAIAEEVIDILTGCAPR